MPFAVKSAGSAFVPLQIIDLSILKSFRISKMLFECPKVSDKYPIKLSSPNFFENFIPSSKFLIKTPADDKKLSAETKKGPMKSFFL